MKKILALSLILLALGSFVFADDAKVMPMMVGRVYVAPTFSFAPGGYDTDGKYHSYDDTVKLFNLGFALEYGVINWITAAIQWAPGWTPWSDVKGAAGPLGNYSEDLNTNGVADLFVGAKVQIVGEKAPVQTSQFRAAIAPGIIIPLPGPDFEDELSDVMAGKKATVSSMDRHVFAAGARLYFDWIINEHFYLNLYNETLFYPVKQDLNKDSPTFAGIKANPTTGGAFNSIDGKVNYKYRLTFEIEPVFTTSIADGISFTAGLPVNYRYIPTYDYSFSYGALAGTGLDIAAKKAFNDNLNTDPQHSLSLKPNVLLFFTKTPLPLEFKLQYGLPIWGQNSMARHDITLQIRVYFALPGRPE